MRSAGTIVAGVFLLAVGLVAQAPRIFVLEDGTAVEASLKKRGSSARLVTVFGEIETASPPTALSPEAEAQLRARFEKAAMALGQKPKRAERWNLVEEALHSGLLQIASEQLEALLHQEVDDEKALALVQELAGRYRLHEAEGSERGRDQRAVVDHLFQREAKSGVLKALMAREKLRSLPKDLVFREALSSLKAKEAPRRFLAAKVLSEMRDQPTRIKPLLERALTDRIFAVRREATRALAVTQDEVFVRLFAKNFAHQHPSVRRNAAEALAEFGHQSAIAPLIAVLAEGGGPIRVNIAITGQTAYVKDFDVEVAQGAVIADPIVDVVQDGTVLDVGLIGVSVVRTTTIAALQRLSGQDFGGDVAAWKRWQKATQKD